MKESSQAHWAYLNLCRLSAADFHSNHHAPTGERATMNESSPGAFGIPEFMPPVGGDFHSNKSENGRGNLKGGSRQ